MTILVFNGSLRENGNTDNVLQNFIEGTESKGNYVHYHMLRELKIENCKGCNNCRNESVCELNDDMKLIHNQIQKCDLIVFASPIYWCEITGLIKTFIDRFYFYHHPNTAHLIEGKKGLIISTIGELENIGYETELVNEFYRRFFKSTKIDLIEHLILPGLMAAEDILQKPEFLKLSYNLGRNLSK